MGISREVGGLLRFATPEDDSLALLCSRLDSLFIFTSSLAEQGGACKGKIASNLPLIALLGMAIACPILARELLGEVLGFVQTLNKTSLANIYKVELV